MQTKHRISRRIWVACSLALAAMLLLAGIALAQAGLPSLDHWVMTSGGGPASGGNIQIDSVMGQPISGTASGGQVELSAGFFGDGGEAVYPVHLPMVLR